MSNSTKSMQQIKQIIQFHTQRISLREIGRRCGISRVTLRIYTRRWDALQLSVDQFSNLDDAALVALLCQETSPSHSQDDRLSDLLPRLPKFIEEMGCPGVTRGLLWEEYRRAKPGGYAYTQFCEYLSQASKKGDAVMRLEHKAAEKMMVDFAGKQRWYIDLETGEKIDCQVFVATLPFSGYCYVEAVYSQNRADFLGAIAAALAYFGGVPACGLSDNLKSAVKTPDRYEPRINDLLEQLSLRYNFTFMATRVAKPRDKASVERDVQLVYQRVCAPLRDQTFHSLAQINQAILQRLDIHHTLPFQNRSSGCRKPIFETIEQPLLRPLPASPFELKFTASHKVQRNYHVQLGCDKHYSKSSKIVMPKNQSLLLPNYLSLNGINISTIRPSLTLFLTV